MISDVQQLAGFVAETFRQREYCRVFCDVLQRCWNVSPGRQEEAVKQFAKEHGWEVKIHEPAGYGMVADFSPIS